MTTAHQVESLDGSEEEPMNERRKITDEADARRGLAAARRAGEHVGSWAQANGVDGRSLNAWRMALSRPVRFRLAASMGSGWLGFTAA